MENTLRIVSPLNMRAQMVEEQTMDICMGIPRNSIRRELTNLELASNNSA